MLILACFNRRHLPPELVPKVLLQALFNHDQLSAVFPLKQTCLQVDISTNKVAPHCSRGSSQKGRGRFALSTIAFAFCRITSNSRARIPGQKLPSSLFRSNLTAEGRGSAYTAPCSRKVPSTLRNPYDRSNLKGIHPASTQLYRCRCLALAKDQHSAHSHRCQLETPP